MKYGFIGFGNMSKAIASGMVDSGLCARSDIFAYDVMSNALENASAKGFVAKNNVTELIKSVDTIFFGVKPQNLTDLLGDIKNYLTEDKLIVSIVTGCSTQHISDLVGRELKIVRCMPNTPAMIGIGASAVCRSKSVNDDEFDIAIQIFDSVGMVRIIDEDKMNEIVPVNGSSPAFIYLFAREVVKNAVINGIDEKVALDLFCQSLIGSAQMMLQSGNTPDELIKMVSSPGGTTLAALDAFEKCGFNNCIAKGVDACIKRAYELGSVNK